MNHVKVSTLADAFGTDSSDDGTPEELYIVDPPPPRHRKRGKAFLLESIAAGSTAAGMMSSTTAAGSVVAALQSIGALGTLTYLGGAATWLTGGGAAVGAAVTYWLFS